MKTSKYPNKRQVSDVLLPFMIVGSFLLAWEILGNAGYLYSLFFPKPTRILASLLDLTRSGEMAGHLVATVSRLFSGLLLGALPGIALGLAMGWSTRLRRIVDPLIAAIHPIPKIAIFPMIMMIFGIGEVSKVVAIGISVFFPVLINSMTGVRQLPPVYFEVAQNYGAGKWKIFQRIVWPGSLPMVFAGLRIGSSVALVIAIAVELVAAHSGLGVLIWFSWQTLRTVDLYSAVVVIAILGIAMNIILKQITGIFLPWKASTKEEGEGF